MNNLASLIFSAMVSSFLYTFILSNFQNIELKSNLKKIILMFLSMAIFIGGGARLLNGVVKIIVLYIILTLFNYLVFNRNKKEGAIYSLVTYSIIIVSEVFGAIILMVLLKIEINVDTINQYNILLHLMIIAVAMLLLNFSISMFKKMNFNDYVKDAEKHRIILYLGANLLILTGFWIYIGTNSHRLGSQIYNISILLILLSTNIALILYQSNISVKEKLIKSISEEKEKREMYIEVMEELMDSIKSFQHDYNNSIRVLRGYIEANQNEKAIQFLNSISKINEDEKILQYYEIKYIEDQGLKSLIISKVSDMIKKNLDFTISVDKINRLGEHCIDTLDLSRVIGIVIDNAIEASEKSINKKVFINILENKCSTEIVVSNSFNEDIKITNLNARGYSTKGDGRGLGLYNVDQILSKYDNVNMFTSINENMFFQKIELVF